MWSCEFYLLKVEEDVVHIEFTIALAYLANIAARKLLRVSFEEKVFNVLCKCVVLVFFCFAENVNCAVLEVA